MLESTTYPGTTRDVLLPKLEAAGRVAEPDRFVAYSPERAAPGAHSTEAIPRPLAGRAEAALQRAQESIASAPADMDLQRALSSMRRSQARLSVARRRRRRRDGVAGGG